MFGSGLDDCSGALLSCAPDQSCAHPQGHNAVFESLKFDQTSIGGRALPVQPLRGPYQRRRRVDEVRVPMPAAIGLTHSPTSGLLCGARTKSRFPGATCIFGEFCLRKRTEELASTHPVVHVSSHFDAPRQSDGHFGHPVGHCQAKKFGTKSEFFGSNSEGMCRVQGAASLWSAPGAAPNTPGDTGAWGCPPASSPIPWPHLRGTAPLCGGPLGRAALSGVVEGGCMASVNVVCLAGTLPKGQGHDYDAPQNEFYSTVVECRVESTLESGRGFVRIWQPLAANWQHIWSPLEET